MNLEKLLEGIEYRVLQGSTNKTIRNLVMDSRKAKEGDLFICIRGAISDGHRFVKEVLKEKVSAVLVESMDKEIKKDFPKATIIQTKDTRKALAFLSANWFKHPAKNLKLIGITGTKGKTTTAGMIKTIFEKAGYKTGLIGTTGVFYGSVFENIPNTTPDALTLHGIFQKMVDSGCTHVVMETSSQGFKHYRTEGLTFEYGLFLNIDNDHIGENEHADFGEYFNCKREIFKQSKKTILNKGGRLWNMLTEDEGKNSITFSTKAVADYYSKDCHLKRAKDYLGMTFELDGKINGKMSIRIPGKYNIENALAAIALADQMAIPQEIILDSLRTFEAEGRTQLLKKVVKYDRTVLVDFAHNGISMRSMLKALKAYNPRKLICVFGMRWNDTKMRRYDMGLATGKYADKIIITEDNQGSETFESINVDIIKGINENNGSYKVIPNREEAIYNALEHAHKDDIIVLIGKGHERYQEINGEKVYFSEEDIVVRHLQVKKLEAISVFHKGQAHYNKNSLKFEDQTYRKVG